MTNQDLKVTLKDHKQTEIKECDGLGGNNFAARKAFNQAPDAQRPSDFNIAVFRIATKGPTEVPSHTHLIHDFTPYVKLAA